MSKIKLKTITRIACKNKKTAAARRKCVASIKRAHGIKAPRHTPKIRACTPSDKGVKSWRRGVANLRAAMERTGNPGKAEMYSMIEEDMVRALRKRCGAKFASKQYHRA